MATDHQVPLFPLHSVLVPGGVLPLRIFEPRYLNMVRDCSREGQPFGICLLLPAVEGDSPDHHARIGTLAGIRDFYTLDDGLLGITVEGLQRFRVLQTQPRDSGLMMARLEILEESPRTVVPDAYLVLTQIVERIMEQVGKQYPDHGQRAIEDAAWVGYRLTELLPLENIEKQVLLELNDPVQRLQRLLEALPRFQSSPEGG